MQIGLYSPRQELLAQMRRALEEFNETAYLDLILRSYGEYAELSASLTDLPLDILFYDTERDPDPKEALQRIMHTIPNCCLILICDDARHALMGYSVKATDYLLTPLDEEDLIATLARFLRQRMESREHYLPVKINGVWSRLNMRHITYLESAGHSLIFHVNDGRTFRCIAHYRDYEGLLEMNPDFFRCHKSYVVNMRYVADWDLNSLTLTDGTSINISRPYRQITRSFYANYITRSQDTPETATDPTDSLL